MVHSKDLKHVNTSSLTVFYCQSFECRNIQKSNLTPVCVTFSFCFYPSSPGRAESCSHNRTRAPFGGSAPPFNPLNVECQSGRHWAPLVKSLVWPWCGFEPTISQFQDRLSTTELVMWERLNLLLVFYFSGLHTDSFIAVFFFVVFWCKTKHK